MNFAENNRISHRQLYRQMILAFTAPFLLCLFGEQRLLGKAGILGLLVGMVLLLIYVIFLIRLGNSCTDLRKWAGLFLGRMIGLLFVIYVIFTGAYLLSVLTEIVPESLLTGVPGPWISFFAVICCSLGTHKGMQRRGRMGEVSGGILLLGILLMMGLCLGQSKGAYLQEMLQAPLVQKEVISCSYGLLCAFSGLGLLPFILENVSQRATAGRTVAGGILTLCGMILGMLLLLPAVFGWERLKEEAYPVLPLLAGADLPGNVLARFDVLWMAFLLYSLLFAIGSLLHYGHQVIHQAHLGTGRFWMPAVMFFLSLLKVDGRGIGAWYGSYLAYIHVPLLLAAQVYLLLGRKGRGKKKALTVAVMWLLPFFLMGCGGVEPEKRMYPLALGVDWKEEQFLVNYGMPDLPAATGQEKEEEGQKSSLLSLKGKTFAEIEKQYGRSQEKYLDMGHLEVLLLGEELLNGEHLGELLAYLKKEAFVGENLYVFQTVAPEEVMSWQGGNGTSVGEYLTGIMENRMTGQHKKGVTLRELYHSWYEKEPLPRLPEIQVQGEKLEILE